MKGRMPPMLRYIPKAGILTWMFLALVFADAANLDDIFLTANIIHDDTDLIAPPPGHQDPPTGTSDTGSHHHADLRVIIDQDSPSLAAVDEVETIQIGRFPLPENAAGVTSFLSDDELHIKIRLLLI
jgi:hypothetical protein